jgi:predicted MFS family arabinose efflux permease
MSDDAVIPHEDASAPPAAWGAVFALTLCVSTLIASEFMPVSLLTPLAADLTISEGSAGQAIAVSGLFAVLTSLSLPTVIKDLDRRTVLLVLTGAMLVSGFVVGLAPNFIVFMAGRALLGIVIGGFWSMSTATVMRLVDGDQVPRALAMLNGGNALATTVAAPLGSFLGQYIGWRGAFFAVVPLAAITFVWQYISLPPMPPDRNARPSSSFGVLRRERVPLGMLAIALLFMGQFALFTFLRPFLERVTQVSVSTLSLLLLIMGVAGFLGSSLIGFVVKGRLTATLIATPTIMAAIALMLILWGHSTVMTAALLAGWGLIGTAAPVAWWTWLSRTLPDNAEAGGGLMVAVIQMAITLGASIGGYLFDRGGYQSTFMVSAGLLIAAAIAGAFSYREHNPHQLQQRRT